MPRLRFSLRAFLLTFTAITVVVGWYISVAEQQKRAVATIHRWGGTVIYDYQYHDHTDPNQRSITINADPPDTWLVNLLGRDYVHRVVGVFGYQEQHYQSSGPVWQLFGPARIDTEFHRDTDAAFESLHSLRSLMFLDLNQTALTDAGLDSLRELRSLQRLSLFRYNITDAGLATVAQISGLKSVTLFETKVTDTGVRQLQAARPELEIWHFETAEVRNGEWVQKSAPIEPEPISGLPGP